MLSRRVIACLDVRDGKVVKGVDFGDWPTPVIRPNWPVATTQEGIDEVVVLDVTATLDGDGRWRNDRRVSAEVFIPVTVGGGIGSMTMPAGVRRRRGQGELTPRRCGTRTSSRLANRYGSQAVVVAIDAQDDDRWTVFSRSGTTAAGLDAVEWAREAADRGAGEILLTSIDHDGTRAGFDCALTAAVSSAVAIPVIASGGAGEAAHFLDVFTHGRADAALAASVFHFSSTRSPA